MTYRPFTTLTLLALFVALAPVALASTTWYVNGVNGSDTYKCRSATTACKTIGHAISRASSGDSIMVAPATYPENLTITISLSILGSGAKTTIIDGRGASSVVTLPNPTDVTLSNVTIQNGLAVGNIYRGGAGVSNNGKLEIVSSTITGNRETTGGCGRYCLAVGGGIFNSGMLTISNSTVSGNSATIGTGCRGG